METIKKALIVAGDFLGWERTPASAVFITRLCRLLGKKGWKVALLTLSGNVFHPDFLSEDERRREFLEAIQDVIIYTTKGWFPSPLDILRHLRKKKATSIKRRSFSSPQIKRRWIYQLLRNFVARIGRVIHPFWRGIYLLLQTNG